MKKNKFEQNAQKVEQKKFQRLYHVPLVRFVD